MVTNEEDILRSDLIETLKKFSVKLEDIRQLFREINYDPERADGWMMKEARNILGDSQFKEKDENG